MEYFAIIYVKETDMKNIGDILKKRRIEMQLTQEEVANRVGVKKATVSRWESGAIGSMAADKIIKLSEVLHISSMTLISFDGNVVPVKFSNERLVTISVLGSVPAGVPLEAIEDKIGEIGIPEGWIGCGKQYIGLRVDGDSMFPKYFDGDIVIVQLADDCDSGKDAVVFVNGYDATLKTLIKNEDGSITLQPINTNYSPKTYGPSAIDETVRVFGVVKQVRRDV